MFAIYTTLTRLVGREDSFASSYGYIAWFGLAGVVVPGLFFWQWPTPGEWFWLLAISATSITGHMLLMKALSLAPASTLQPFNYTQLLWGIVFGIVVFAEYPHPLTLLGAAVVVAGGIAAARLS